MTRKPKSKSVKGRVVCACEDCTEPATRVGLCDEHFEESQEAREVHEFRQWCADHNVYFSRMHETPKGGERIFRNAGKWVQDVCKCGNTYERPERGTRRKCPSCLYQRRKTRWTKQNAKRLRFQKVKKMLANRGDQDPNFKPYKHNGRPLSVTWYCEFPGCGKSYPVVLLEQKERYPRFCPQHRGLK